MSTENLQLNLNIHSTNLPVESRSRALMLSVCPLSFRIFDPDLVSQTRTTYSTPNK